MWPHLGIGSLRIQLASLRWYHSGLGWLGDPMSKTPCFYSWGPRFKQSLVRELRSFMPGCLDKKWFFFFSCSYKEAMCRDRDTVKKAMRRWRQRLGGYRSKPRNAWGHQKTGRGRENSALESWEGAWLCQYPDFILLASRTMKEYISVVLSCQVCGNWYSRPQN